ncbi:MAG TPA: hypothetical protein VGK85_04805 [Myxococcaceae bacterium]
MHGRRDLGSEYARGVVGTGTHRLESRPAFRADERSQDRHGLHEQRPEDRNGVAAYVVSNDTGAPKKEGR